MALGTSIDCVIMKHAQKKRQKIFFKNDFRIFLRIDFYNLHK